MTESKSKNLFAREISHSTGMAVNPLIESMNMKNSNHRLMLL